MFLCKMTTLLRVTFQPCKSSTVLRQHHTLESLTVDHSASQFAAELMPFRRKIPKNITKGERPSCSVAITKVRVLSNSIKYLKINKQQIIAYVVLFLDRVTTGHPRLMEMPADHFSGNPFPILPDRTNSSDCRLKGFNSLNGPEALPERGSL